MKLIITKIKEHLGLFLTAIFFLMIESLSDLLQPTLMAHIVDDGVKNQDVGTVLCFGGIMLGVAFIGAAGAVIRNNLSVRTSQQLERSSAQSYTGKSSPSPLKISTGFTLRP